MKTVIQIVLIGCECEPVICSVVMWRILLWIGRVLSLKTAQFHLTVVDLFRFVFKNQFWRNCLQENLGGPGSLHWPADWTFVPHGWRYAFQAFLHVVLRYLVFIVNMLYNTFAVVGLEFFKRNLATYVVLIVKRLILFWDKGIGGLWIVGDDNFDLAIDGVLMLYPN